MECGEVTQTIRLTKNNVQTTSVKHAQLIVYFVCDFNDKIPCFFDFRYWFRNTHSCSFETSTQLFLKTVHKR